MATSEEHSIQSAAPTPESTSAGSNPDESTIAELAYQLWLERGSPEGSSQEDWFRAESILKDAKQPE
jgi:hypothetical protein